MFNKQTFLKRKYFFISGCILLTILLLGLFEPVLLRNSEKNWEYNLKSKISKVKVGIQDYFADEEKSLNEKINSVITCLTSPKKTLSFTEIINSKEWSDYSIIIIDSSGKMAASANFNDSIKSVPFNEYKMGQMYFLQTSLIDYLSVYSGFVYNSNNYKILLSKPVEKKYQLNTSYFKNISLKEDLTKKYQTDIELHPGKEEIGQNDGRMQSVEILNLGKEKIATVVFDNPSLSNELNKKRELISFLQILCFLILIVVLLKKIKGIIDRLKSRMIQSVFVVILIVALRVLFFIFQIPTRFITGSLTDASYFSSTFGFGIVSSPLDLFLTVISILCIVILIYDAVRTLNYGILNDRKILRIICIAALGVLYLLLLRAFGASIRSVIFDSTLKYFKDPFIIPDLPLFVMHLNILLIGLSVILFSIAILLLSFKLLGNIEIKAWVLIFIVLQIIGYSYDAIQSNPQGNNLTRVLYIFFTLAAAYWVLKNNSRTIFEYSVFLVLASFLSILLLNFYNKELEKASLPYTAQEFMRRNENLNEFMAIQAAIQFSKENELLISYSKADNNYDALAFKLWSKSVLPKEILSVHVAILNIGFEELGHYDYNFESHNKIDWQPEKGKEYLVKSIEEPFANKRMYAVLAPVKVNGARHGYIELIVHPLNNYFNRKQCYNILSSYNQRLNSTIDFSQLKMFLAADGEVKSSIGDLGLSSPDLKYFEDCLKKNGDDTFQNKEIDGKSYVVFLKKESSSSGNAFLGIALRTRDITLDLFDFFKVFFIHSSIIMIFTLLAFLSQIRKLWQTLFNFRARLLYSLVVISIVPLFLSALYFKALVEEKNQEDVNFKLNKRATQLERYLHNYYTGSSLVQKEIFEKAHSDLGIEYSLYDDNGLIYTTTPGFYKSTLLPMTLNSIIKEYLIDKKGEQILIPEKIDDFSYNSVYVKTMLGDKDLFINVNNAFNEVTLSLSNLEVDIFLFGSYSFAAVMIVLLSSFLSGQISRPIRELTKATSAVAEGDLDVSVDYKATGEINNLILGFNDMVEKLKKSQLDLAEFERETAWKEMARQVAHEIKNPLTPMKLSIQQLIASYNDKSPKFDAIFGKVTSTIIGQIETLNKIASEFSSFARMPKMKIEKVELKKICSEAVYLFDSDLKIKISCGKNPIEIMADPDHLKRSFINLIRNSIQANAAHIEIVLTEITGKVEIRFIDDGHGIAKDNIERIFDENFTTKEKGMGLGLSMAKKYFESLNGSITVVSTSEKGTEFSIVIPKAVNL